MASKEDIKGVTTRLDGIDSRLDRIEHLLLAEQKCEIEKLKTRLKRLEDALAACNAPRLSSGHERSALAGIVCPFKLPGRLVAQG